MAATYPGAGVALGDAAQAEAVTTPVAPALAPW